MHHPPFETGIWEFDNIGLSGCEAFGEIISQNSQVQAIACGHVHRDIVTSWCGALVTVTPSTGHQYALRLGELRGFKRVTEPAICRLFWWNHDGGLVSHISYVTA
jgi:Icc-related predicted phosphoesterase